MYRGPRTALSDDHLAARLSSQGGVIPLLAGAGEASGREIFSVLRSCARLWVPLRGVEGALGSIGCWAKRGGRGERYSGWTGRQKKFAPRLPTARLTFPTRQEICLTISGLP